MAKAFFGGVHPKDKKAATCDKAIERIPAPAEVVIPLSQHIGAPCKCLVAVGDTVKVGQKIGEPAGFVSAPVHASVSGKVKAIEERPFTMGGNTMCVVIENDYLGTVCEDIHPVENPDDMTAEQFCEVVRNAGIVGMGGATFPTHVKISGGIGKCDTVIVNAVECEPYITGDDRAMLEYAEEVLGGAGILARMFKVDKVYLCIEDNKPRDIALMEKLAAERDDPVVVMGLHTRYPQGAEKQLCQAVTGRQVPPGALPSAIGCVVLNLNTVIAIYRAVYKGMPVVSKVVTVSGSGVMEPKNLLCPIGTPVSVLLDNCGGVKDTTFKIIAGGPMMGLAQYTTDVPVTKGVGSILAFAENEERTVANPQCIRCGRCVEACPMHLEPLYMYKYTEKKRIEDMERLNLMDCIECGACTYICPARVHLVQMFRVGKQLINADRAAKKAAAEAAAKEAAAKEEKEA
ncbi:MAG: electron transport complex subunit RsxC [Oscillospiraceae bacterium]|nr:electron transport complex subunit RsxC [Oscillospiraceae bacterium]